MSNGIKYFVTFALGAAVGSVAAWRFLKSKYEKLAKEEIDEVREYYHQKEVDEAMAKQEFEEYEDIVGSYTHNVNTHVDKADQEGGSGTLTFNPTDTVPYVISPEEFASDDEYQSESLTLYACGTLTDDFDNPIEDVEAMVGDALEHFGEYDGDDDSVFVRNDRYKCNYEVLKDVRTFEEVRNRTMNLVENDE